MEVNIMMMMMWIRTEMFSDISDAIFNKFGISGMHCT
jgi:hypothetical protein